MGYYRYKELSIINKKHTTMKIETEYIHPPIPIRNFDWQATREGYDQGDLIGHGSTEREAINNLLDQEE